MNLGITLNLVGLLLCSKDIYLIPGGQNIAFEIKSNGVIITSTYDVNYNNTTYNPSVDSNINKGDIILGVNNKKIDSLDSFIYEFNKYINDDYITLLIKDDDKYINKDLRLIKINEEVKTGLYVKDRLVGIGTVSFYDVDNNIYGALGHEVVDSSSSEIIELRSGTIYESKVIGINNDSTVGEKIADTSLSNDLGSITINSKYGIYGSIDEVPSSYTPIKMGFKSDCHLGEAYIKTVIKGELVEDFKINIINLKKQDGIDIKGIEFNIVDDRLLALGGIYKGMSGSPIIQDNLLIGAVTHVKSNNTNSGYGIYMESMYEYALNNM